MKLKTKKVKKSNDDEPAGGVSIDMSQHVALTFSLKYLVNFAKSSSLSDTVQLMMSNDVPLLVSTNRQVLLLISIHILFLSVRFRTNLDRVTFTTTSHRRLATTKNRVLIHFHNHRKCGEQNTAMKSYVLGV